MSNVWFLATENPPKLYCYRHTIDFMLRHKNEQNHKMSQLELFVWFLGDMAFNLFEINMKGDRLQT